MQAIIIEEVKRKQKDPEVETGDPDDYDNVYEDAGNKWLISLGYCSLVAGCMCMCVCVCVCVCVLCVCSHVGSLCEMCNMWLHESSV